MTSRKQVLRHRHERLNPDWIPEDETSRNMLALEHLVALLSARQIAEVVDRRADLAISKAVNALLAHRREHIRDGWKLWAPILIDKLGKIYRSARGRTDDQIERDIQEEFARLGLEFSPEVRRKVLAPQAAGRTRTPRERAAFVVGKLIGDYSERSMFELNRAREKGRAAEEHVPSPRENRRVPFNVNPVAYGVRPTLAEQSALLTKLLNRWGHND